MTKMVGKTSAPPAGNAVAGLQDRPHTPTGATLDQPEMAAMVERHEGEDGIGLAVSPTGEDDALVLPLHAGLRPRYAQHETIHLRRAAAGGLKKAGANKVDLDTV